MAPGGGWRPFSACWALRQHGGLTVVASKGRPPNTAAETISKGGDCTELAFVVLAVINAMNARGAGIRVEAPVVHFHDSPPGEEHMLVSVEVKGRKTMIDLQAPELGMVTKGKYDVVFTLTADTAAAMYHCEYGDYFKDAGKPRLALIAYERSLLIFDGDAYVHQNAGVLYEKLGDMEMAAYHFDRANALAPGRYSRDTVRGSYNQELKVGEKEYDAGEYCGCRKHFQNALDSGEKLKPQERTVIESYRDACARKCTQQ